MQENIHVAFGLEDSSGDYYTKILTVIIEIFTHTKENIYIHILHDKTLLDNNKKIMRDIVEKHKQNIKFYDISMLDKLQEIEHIAMNKGMLYRLYMPDLCANVNKIIYLDADVLVMGDIKDLWNVDMDCKLIAAVKDLEYTRNIYIKTKYYEKMGVSYTKYFNSGVMLLDLDNIRREKNLIGGILSFAKRYPYCAMLDQDYLNWEFRDRVLLLPAKYNYIELDINDMDKQKSEGKLLIHCAGPFKPWNCRNPFIIRYFCKHYAEIISEENKLDSMIEYMSMLPELNFKKMGLKHSLLQQKKKTFVDCISCICKGIISDSQYQKMARFFMFYVKMKFLYSFLYLKKE